MTPAQKTERQELLIGAHHEYEKGLNAYAYFKVSDRVMSEDLVQDTFMKTWSYLVRGGEINLMRAFLYHILNNLIVDEYRKNKTTSLDALVEKGFEPAAPQPERFLNILDGKNLLRLIPQLPETYQKVMRMRYIQDLSLKDISLITGQSRNTVAVQAHRGLEKLKTLYQAS